ncbi:MAG: DUF2721 domain-containing protein [Candidatus Caenarcaniphilales bacterium]|nr:DUF2721 domain-containing protein [Candidatus Caenarcaniphilales bacterium]
MNFFEFINLPFNLLSGVGLLILSTSARYGTLKRRLIEYSNTSEKKTYPESYVSRQIKRAHFLRNALFLLYVSISLMTINSLMITVFPHLGFSGFFSQFLSVVNVLLILLAAIQLMLETSLSLKIIEGYAEL